MKHHKKNSKRQKLSLKYNIQKRVRESKRRIKKEAKRMGISKNTRKKKDPGIPNSWPFKAELLQEIERKKEQRDEEFAKKKAMAKEKAKKDQKIAQLQKKKDLMMRDRERRHQRAEAVRESQMESLKKVLGSADAILEVLDARDPQGCRCASLEAWAQEQGKRLIFVLAKADLVAPHHVVRWMQALGREGAAIAVQAEAGREGIAELLRMLGHAPKSAAASKAIDAAATAVAQAQAVGVVGYQGTGKKALIKAMRQEAKAAAKWLLESVGHLRPPTAVAAGSAAPAAPSDAAAALHLAVRGQVPKGDAWQGSTATKAAKSASGPLAVVAHLLERVQAQALMRRFRLPAFSSAEELLKLFAKQREMKSRAGKEPAPEAVARRLLAELGAAPGCICTPTEGAAAPPRALWQPHGEAPTAALKALMEAQAAQLQGRDAGPAGSALELTSAGFGASVDVAAVLSATAADSGDESMDDDEDDEAGIEEGEEEEDMEGDESEDMSDEE